VLSLISWIIIRGGENTYLGYYGNALLSMVVSNLLYSSILIGLLSILHYRVFSISIIVLLELFGVITYNPLLAPITIYPDIDFISITLDIVFVLLINGMVLWGWNRVWSLKRIWQAI